MNILILSCGTRCKLVKYFMDRENGFKKVVVTDCSRYAPALYVADQFYIVSKMNDPMYIQEILDICERENINVILPLHEEEILLISKQKSLFEKKGIFVAISNYEPIMLCKDKYNMYKFLNECGVQTVETELPEQYLKGNVEFNDIFIKPRYGAGSIGTMIVKSRHLLKAIMDEHAELYVVQPYLSGKEYGVDVYVDFITGDINAVFCKEKIRMKAGETEKSISIKNVQIENLVKNAIRNVDLRGPVDVDILEYGGEYYILEINPRFGGGYPHAYECGVNFIKKLYINASKKANGHTSSDYEEGVVGLKYSEITII